MFEYQLNWTNIGCEVASASVENLRTKSSFCEEKKKHCQKTCFQVLFLMIWQCFLGLLTGLASSWLIVNLILNFYRIFLNNKKLLVRVQCKSIKNYLPSYKQSKMNLSLYFLIKTLNYIHMNEILQIWTFGQFLAKPLKYDFFYKIQKCSKTISYSKFQIWTDVVNKLPWITLHFCTN